MSPIRTLGYRADIDGLRAVAVIAVVIFHAFPRTAPGGFVGVDIFFVISGFLISGILFRRLEAGAFSYREFYAHRIRRIFPALGVVLAVCAAVGWFAMQPDQYRRLGEEMVSGAAFFSNLLLWRAAGYFDAIAETKPLLHLWSLGVEEQFYLFWPVLLAALWRRRINLLAVTLIVATLSFALNVLTIQTHPDAAFYSPLSRLWELMAGGALAHVAMHRPQILARHQEARSVIGFALLAVSIAFLNSAIPFPGWAALLPVGGAMLVLSSPDAWTNRRVLSAEPLRAVGLISYPLYLWHWPLLFAVRNLSFWSSLGDPAARAAAIAISVVLSVATYVLIEMPIRFGPIRARATGPLAALMVAICGVGVWIVAMDGFSYRVDAQTNRLAHLANFYIGDEWRDHRCFLEPEQDQSKFVPECAGSGRPLTYLWGDSHAAMLYPGLRDWARSRSAGLAEYTASACAPLAHISFPDRPFCQGINDWILAKITQDKPQTVLLNAAWVRGKSVNTYNPEYLRATVAELRRVGVQRIVVFGPAPLWTDALPSLLVKCSRQQTSISGNQYSKCGLQPGLGEVDRAVAHTAASLGIEYVSLLDTLCNAAGCLTMLNHSSVSAYDIAHLSPVAGRYVIDRNADLIFGHH